MARLTEKRLYRVDPQPFTTDGTNTGMLTIANTSLFVVGHQVILESSTQPAIKLKINRIINKFTMLVGPTDKPVHIYQDISAFLVADGATIKAAEQPRPNVPEQEIERNTYDEEPVVARRVRIIDKYGDDAASPTSVVQQDDPVTKFFYGPALEVVRILEYSPGAQVGDIVKETFFTYGPALEVVKIEAAHRPAVAGDLT